ncbi:MAG: bifunctional methionine sulfoxide reductase B/A protein [Candidatus Colwellbacteria bacterium]|nr:bifunctional methionine sulfoxide reductase B/A protein [Candidatus Colwellbacteria bacterium]
MQLNSLTSEERSVIEEKGTEAPFKGEYDNFFKEGIYTCRRCGARLYRSESKFDANCGWPSFDSEVHGSVKKIPDTDGLRTEIICARCGAHLGHVFTGEGHTPKNVRHCVNSISMRFIPKAEIKDASETAYLAAGCFWCTEAVFQSLEGVLKVTPGYAGGQKENPTYKEVSKGDTGYIETAKIEFDPDTISYEALLEVFFASHDPTSKDRQGDDVGTQYRSAIFYTDELQREIAERHIKELREGEVYSKPMVTDVRPVEKFYEAEDYHKNYYESHKDAPYCRNVISPKLVELRKKYGNLFKK